VSSIHSFRESSDLTTGSSEPESGNHTVSTDNLNHAKKNPPRSGSFERPFWNGRKHGTLGTGDHFWLIA
jgi:hypothetical protein